MTLTKSKLLFPALSCILGLYYTLPFLLKYNYWGVRDWDLFTSLAAVPVGTIVHYGQFPFWNPYLAGGNVLFHHPEVAVLSPFLVLYLVFGAVAGLKLQVLTCYVIGFWGSHRLFTSLGMSKLASLMASVAYFGSVHFALHFAEGHMPFTHYCFLPWFVYFVLRATENRRFIILAGVSLALMVLGNGGAIPLLYTLTFSILFFGLRSLQSRTITDLKHLLLSVLAGLGLAGVKYVPMVVYMVQNRWKGSPDESIPVSALGSIFFGLNHSIFARNFQGQYWNWHEYGAYISPLLVVMALGVLIARFRRHWIWAVLALFFLLLGLGNFGALSPWAILSHLPGFYSARCTGRAFHFVILSVAVLGGLGLDWLRDRLSRYRLQNVLNHVPGVLVLVVIVVNCALAWSIMSSAFRQPPKRVHRSHAFSHVITRDTPTYENFLANRGSLWTPELSATHPSRALVSPDNTVLMEMTLLGRAEIRYREYTPNRIEYRIDGRQAGDMVISMGYDPGWYAENGRHLRQEQGLITFAFSPGVQQIVLKYRSPYLFAGLAVSLLTLAAIVVAWRRWQSDGKAAVRVPDSG